MYHFILLEGAGLWMEWVGWMGMWGWGRISVDLKRQLEFRQGLLIVEERVVTLTASHALRWHPDRKQNHGNEHESRAKFQAAKEAFDFLSAPS